jgi:hypothetical protein
LIYLTDPRWLWVSSGIVIPILIHLAKGRSGKTLRIGSIHLLRENIISQSSSLKIRERILLCLRCLGIVVASIFLSSPEWIHFFGTNKHAGWVLLEKNCPPQALETQRPLIDSLLHDGFELHLLEEDFPKTRLKETLTLSPDSADPSLPSYWSLLENLEQQVPADLPLYIFTGYKLNRFSGDRPALSLNLHWILLESDDRTASWVSTAYLTSLDSMRVLTGQSTHTRTWFQSSLLTKEGFEKTNDLNIIPDSIAMKVAVYSPPDNPDGFYLQTALEAVRAYTQHPLTILKISQMDSIPPTADWIFWLSSDPFPDRLHPKHLFMYKPGAPVATHTWIVPSLEEGRSRISVYKIIGSQNESVSETLWQDGFGRPLLTVEKKEAPVFSFYSRIDPAWNDLPWSADFPRFILQLLYPENLTSADRSKDQREISRAQAIPSLVSEAGNRAYKKFQQTDLYSVFWILLFIIFCLERLLSWKKKQPIHE